MNIAKSIAGVTDDKFGSLLSSVPVEMIFGDLRDSCKRHAKQEVTAGCNIHSVVARSCSIRNENAATITPSGCDWSKPLAGKTLKQQVFDSSRCTDKSLGVSTLGLTKKRSVTEFTKPHIFTQRLSLMDSLLKIWRNAADEESFSIDSAFRSLWISSLVERGLLIQMRGVEKTMIAVKGGPYSVRCMPLVHVLRDDDQFYTFETPSDVMLIDIPMQDLCTYQVCCSTPTIQGGQLSWQHCGDWMFLPAYVAKHSIVRLAAKTLTALCSMLKLKGFSKMDHKGKVRLYMEHFEQDETRILEVLEQIPDPKPRGKRKKEENGEAETNDNDEEQEQDKTTEKTEPLVFIVGVKIILYI